jgi:hypothetical protein
VCLGTATLLVIDWPERSSLRVVASMLSLSPHIVMIKEGSGMMDIHTKLAVMQTTVRGLLHG